MDSSKTSTPINPAHPNAPGFIFVWDWPLRAIHWGLVIAVVVAWFTPNTYDTTHRVAGYSVMILIVLRIVWGFAGTRYSRFQRYRHFPFVIPRYLRDLLRGRPGRYVGLNPAGILMAIALLLSLAVSAVTGWLQVTEKYFGIAWVQDLHTVSSYLVAVLAVMHLASVLIVGRMQRANLILSMITGWKRRRRSAGK